jgi:hypothetical protein
LADESLGPNFDTPSNNTKKEEILFVEKRTVGSEETTESVSFASRTENDLFDVMPPWEQNMDQDSDPTLKADDFSQTGKRNIDKGCHTSRGKGGWQTGRSRDRESTMVRNHRNCAVCIFGSYLYIFPISYSKACTLFSK